MASRLKLQEELEKIPGIKKVYFQPPESIKMEYPCVRYSLETERTIYADNRKYKSTKQYSVMIIDRNPDSEIGDIFSESFPMCSMDRSYVADGLHHFVYTLFY